MSFISNWEVKHFAAIIGGKRKLFAGRGRTIQAQAVVQRLLPLFVRAYDCQTFLQCLFRCALPHEDGCYVFTWLGAAFRVGETSAPRVHLCRCRPRDPVDAL